MVDVSEGLTRRTKPGSALVRTAIPVTALGGSAIALAPLHFGAAVAPHLAAAGEGALLGLAAGTAATGVVLSGRGMSQSHMGIAAAGYALVAASAMGAGATLGQLTAHDPMLGMVWGELATVGLTYAGVLPASNAWRGRTETNTTQSVMRRIVRPALAVGGAGAVAVAASRFGVHIPDTGLIEAISAGAIGAAAVPAASSMGARALAAHRGRSAARHSLAE